MNLPVLNTFAAPPRRPRDAIGPWSPPGDPFERYMRGHPNPVVHDSVVLDADDVRRIEAAARKREERAKTRLATKVR